MDNKQESSHTFHQQWKTVLMLNNLINSDKGNTILNSIYKGQILKEKKKQKKKNKKKKTIRPWVFFLYHIAIFDSVTLFCKKKNKKKKQKKTR